MQKIHREFGGLTALSDVSLDVNEACRGLCGSVRTVVLAHKGRTELREAAYRVVEQMGADRSLQKALEENPSPTALTIMVPRVT